MRIVSILKYRGLKLIEKTMKFYNNLILVLWGTPEVKNIDETIEEIIKHNYSVSRYGDGEFTLMKGKDLRFQKYEYNLELRLKNIIKSNYKSHIVCIPDVFRNTEQLSIHTLKYWRKFLNLNRSKIYKMIDMEKLYYNSFVTRLYMELNEKDKANDRFKKIKKIWNNRNLIIVEGEKSRLGIGNDLFDNANSIKRIICPSRDAFSKYDEILKEIIKYSNKNLILIALGPTATVLSYDLAKYGYQAIDIGHIDIEYEWFLKGALEKCKIEHKCVDEVRGGSEVKSINDDIYNKQILISIN